MRDVDLEQRFASLERRLGRIESHLKLAPEPFERPAPVAPPPMREALPRVLAAESPHLPLAPPTTPVAPPFHGLSQVAEQEMYAEAARRAAPPPPVATMKDAPPVAPGRASGHTAATPARAPLPRPPQAPRGSLELQIGTRWLAWVGAIVVVLGVGLFVKLAFDNGWIGRLPAELRCLFAAAFGGVLLTAGELALRRVGRHAAVGLFGAGLGTLYLTAFAASRYFNLVSDTGAFWLMTFVAALGFALTLHARMLPIGVLSLLGGYLSPILLHSAAASPIALPIYTTALLAVALALAVYLPRPFAALRETAFAAHVLLMTVWALSLGGEDYPLVLACLLVWWTLILVSAVWVARAGERPVANVFLTLLATAWFAALGCYVLTRPGPGPGAWQGGFAMLVAVLAALTAYFCGPDLAGLRNLRRTALDQLAVALWAQAGILTAVAAGLHFEGYGITVSWLALAVGSVEIGRRIAARRVDVFGLCVGAIALVRLLTVELLSEPLRGAVYSTAHLSLNGWAILALLTLAALLVAAFRLRPGDKAIEAWPQILTGLAVFGWLALCGLQAQGLAITWGWLLAAVALLATRRFAARQSFAAFAGLALVATAGRHVIADVVVARLDPTWQAGAVTPILNGAMALALATAAVGAWWWRTLIQRDARGPVDSAAAAAPSAPSDWWQSGVLFGAAFLLTSFSFQLEHAIRFYRGATPSADLLLHALLTALWACGALAIGVFGATVSAPPGRAPARLLTGASWVALLGCAVKWAVLDMLLIGALAGGASGDLPLANVPTIVGLAIAGALLLMLRTALRAVAEPKADGAQPRRDGLLEIARWVPVGAALLVLWALTFEVERLVGRWELAQPAGRHAVWAPEVLRALWFTLLWALGAAAMIFVGRRRPWQPLLSAGWTLLLGAAGAWLTLDTLAPRLTQGVAVVEPVMNLQCLSGLGLAALALLARWETRRAGRGAQLGPAAFRLVNALSCAAVALVGLWAGSLELDRFFAPEAGRFAEGSLARHTAWSVYWGVYALALLAAGFAWRAAWFRYSGLVLLGVTLAKVLLVDMSQAPMAYRVLSVLAVGLLFVAASVAYARLATRLRAGAIAPSVAEPPSAGL